VGRTRRVDILGILADPDLRRELMVPTLQATQAREGIETTREQAERAYYVVTEAERVAFFDLARFRGRRLERDRRHEMFVRTLRGDEGDVRLDVARRDFGTIEGSPMAYRQVGLLSYLFRSLPPTVSFSEAHQGLIARPDEPYLRYHWEVAPNRATRPWVTLHKGGDYSRFYFDADLVIDWSKSARESFHRLRDERIYFKPGLTWPRRTQKGFNLRKLPSGCVFSDKGPAIFFQDLALERHFLAVANSTLAEWILQSLTSFGSWELTAIRRFPLAAGTSDVRQRLGDLADGIHDTKASWDNGNETSTRFRMPWLLRDDLVNPSTTVRTRLERLAELEADEEMHIQRLYSELNEEVFRLYGMSSANRLVIEEALAERPPEVLWPQMEDRTPEQKRMEHVFRLLSYVVKRVVEADEDDIVPFASVAGEPSLLERVIAELEALFPQREVGQIEIEIANELKRGAKGYRRTTSIAGWLENAFFDYHCGLYKNRPIIWHIASAQGMNRFAFGALVHYHRFNKNRIGKLRGQYLRDAIESFRREAALADRAGRSEERLEWQSRLEEAQDLDRRLQWVQEGRHEGPEAGERDFRILTPWKSPAQCPKGWDPDLDDGVKVNIGPMQKAGVLRIARVV
jgi:hypothetical protein